MASRRITVNQALTLEYDYDRKVVVPQAVIDALKEWQARLSTFHKGPELLEANSPVFCNTLTGQYRTYNGFCTTYRRFLEQHGFDSTYGQLLAGTYAPSMGKNK